MLAASDATFGPAIAWLLACLVGWLGARHWVGPWVRAHPYVVTVAAGSTARLIPTLVLDRGLPFDIEAHWWVGVLALAGRDVYAAPLAQGRYPYPPLHMYVSALMVWLSGDNRTTFLLVDKLIPALFGIAIVPVVYAIALRLDLSRQHALLVALLYALNPLPVLVTAYHGQVEEIPLFFSCLAFLLLVGKRPGSSAIALSSLLLGVAIAYKTWPLLFLAPLVVAVRGWMRRLLYLVLALVPLATSIGLYGMAFGPLGMREVVHRLLSYHGSTGFCWGYVATIHPCWIRPARLSPHAWIVPLSSKILLVGLLLAGLLLLWRRRPLEGMVAFPLIFYLFSPGWGPNYSIWVLPFALLLSVRLGIGYTLIMLSPVGLIYFDSLYAAYPHSVFSWTVLKPVEAALGLAGWCGVAAMVVYLYLSGERPAPTHRRPPPLDEAWHIRRAALE